MVLVWLTDQRASLLIWKLACQVGRKIGSLHVWKIQLINVQKLVFHIVTRNIYDLPQDMDM